MRPLLLRRQVSISVMEEIRRTELRGAGGALFHEKYFSGNRCRANGWIAASVTTLHNGGVSWRTLYGRLMNW